MGHYSDSIVAAVLGKRPSSTGWLRGNCPLCAAHSGEPDKSQALGVSVTTGRWRCFRCGERGTVPLSLLGVDGLPYVAEKVPDRPEYVDPPEGFVELGRGPGLTAESTAEIRSYLRGRGVPPATWRAARIGTSTRGMFAGRVIVPVLGKRGWLGYVTRVMPWGRGRRYMNSSGAIPSVLNAAALAKKTAVPCLVVEGAFDALPFWPDAVALLGKPTELRRQMLARARRPLAVALDGDAWVEGEALAWELELDGADVSFVKLPPGSDPNTQVEFLRDSVW